MGRDPGNRGRVLGLDHAHMAYSLGNIRVRRDLIGSRIRTVLAILALGSGVPASSAPAQTRVVPPEASVRPEGFLEPRFFRLSPDDPDTTFELLVIPVRFPEDEVLGRGERAGILGQLEGDDPRTLEGFYLAATGGRLRVRPTLAPTVVAEHPRTYYTNEGPGNLGYGIDPRAYPHNAQRLVEEVTGKLADRVDFARFDNTRDGIADGLLVLQSGPEAPEGGDPPSGTDVLIAHSFTVSEPVDRGGAQVFPYAIAATRDPVGPWAHEVGHLLGLPDLYVANPICFDDGVGEWSLMATGANRNRGEDPSGFDAYSRQWMGFAPTPAPEGTPMILEEGQFVRVFRPGFENGPRYFLVERRTGENGLGLDFPAMVVYLVDEEAGDNRSCMFPSESYRPLVEVRADICLSTACATRLDDFSVPNLRDRDGSPTGLVLEFSGDTLRVYHETPLGAHFEKVGLGGPHVFPDSRTGQALILTLTSDTPDVPVELTLDVTPLDPTADCVYFPDPEWRRTLAPGETLVDSTWAVVGCIPGVYGNEEALYELTLRRAGTAAVGRDTLALPLIIAGWNRGLAGSFETVNLNPPRDNPWVWNGTAWTAGPLDPLAAGEVATPWFTVPAGATLVLEHRWDLEALSPDVALDGGQVRLRRPYGPDVLLSPDLGWGYTAERKIGNALAGQEVLSDAGSRVHVIPLSGFATDVVRIVFRAAGDVTGGSGLWSLENLLVAPAPPETFTLSLDEDGRTLFAETASGFQGERFLIAYQGREAITPVVPLGQMTWNGTSRQELGRVADVGRRFEIVWRAPDGSAGSAVAILDPTLPAGARLLGLPYPNPLPGDRSQTWPVILPQGSPRGNYEVRLYDVTGRLRVERRVRVDTTGIRELTWNGRDDTGRQVPGGVYFLQVHRPDGKTDARKIVVLP